MAAMRTKGLILASFCGKHSCATQKWCYVCGTLYTTNTQAITEMNKSMTFETTYTRYSFAPLVAFGIAVAAGLNSVFGKTSTGSREDGKSLIGSGQPA